MKKVLFTATVDSHIKHFHLPYLKWFKENGWEVHVATNGEEEIPYCDKKIKISFERSPFKTNNLKAIKQLKKVLKEEKYDIIHTHTPMGSVVTRLAAKNINRDKMKLIYTAHGFHFFKGAPILNWLLFYPVEKYLSKYTDILITINKEDYELVKRNFKKCKDIRLIPGVGIDYKKFDFKMSQDEKYELRKSLGIKEKDLVLIYPAELNKNKNQIALINIMEKVLKEYPDVHLVLPGIDSYNGYYQKIIKEKRLTDNIHVIGYRNDIPKLLKISDIAVSTSKREGLPVNIMESMCVGLPIIATNCRGNRDLVIDEKNGYLVELNDEEEFLKKLKILLQSPDKRKLFSDENIEEIQKYLLENVMAEMEKIYNCC